MKKRVAGGDIVIVPTDKSGKMTIYSLEKYERAGKERRL